MLHAEEGIAATVASVAPTVEGNDVAEITVFSKHGGALTTAVKGGAGAGWCVECRLSQPWPH